MFIVHDHYCCNGYSYFEQAITTSVSRKVNIVDIERGTPLLAYDNCASPLEVRQPLIVHPSLPYLAACTTVNARGITLLDLRMPLPLDFIYDVSQWILPWCNFKLEIHMRYRNFYLDSNFFFIFHFVEALHVECTSPSIVWNSRSCKNSVLCCRM